MVPSGRCRGNSVAPQRWRSTYCGKPAPQVLILAVTSMVIEFLVQLGYALLAGRAARFAAQPRFARITDRVSGSLLIGAGIGMAALRRGA